MPYGQDAVLAIAFQNSRGAAVTDAGSFYTMPFLSESIAPQRPELLRESMEGRYDEGEAYQGARQVAGTIVSESQPITIGVMLQALLGDPTSVQSTDIYTHTFQPRTSDFSVDEINQPMTAWKNMADGGQVLSYQDLIAVRGELSVANGEFLQMTLDYVGGGVATKTTSQAIGAAVGKNWTWDVASFELDGVANVQLDDFRLTIDEQASPKWTVRTSRDPQRVKRDGRRQVRFNGTIRFQDQTEYDLFMANSSQSLRVTMTGPTEIQSGYFDTLVINIPSFKYLEYPAVFPDASELSVSFTGKADYNTGSGTSIEFTLINTISAF